MRTNRPERRAGNSPDLILRSIVRISQPTISAACFRVSKVAAMRTTPSCVYVSVY